MLYHEIPTDEERALANLSRELEDVYRRLDAAENRVGWLTLLLFVVFVLGLFIGSLV